jgi:8-oxo-dGTP pyrophosphatase MutT (NUDIX family)
MDKVLYQGKWLSVIERDGWYHFSRESRSGGVVYVLAYRTDDAPMILGRYEICPAHSDATPTLTSITGGVPDAREPIDIAVEELREEAGYDVDVRALSSLGKVNLTKSCDTIGHLYAVNLSGLERHDALGDGSRGEIGSYCDWVSVKDAVRCKCPILASMIIRLQEIYSVHLY